MRQRAEITHIKPAAARFAFVKMPGLAQWRSARLLADDRPARDHWRHARYLGHAISLQIEQSSPDRQIYFGRNHEGHTDPDGRKPNELAPIHKSTRMPLKNG